MYGFASTQRQQAVDPDNEAYWIRILKGSQRRLRKIFEAIRDILKTLVPDYEQKAIVERLDVDLIMQEISNGMCDLIALSNWLAKVLQAHCAPMRDELVEAMKMDIQTGALESSHEQLCERIATASIDPGIHEAGRGQPPNQTHASSSHRGYH